MITRLVESEWRAVSLGVTTDSVARVFNRLVPGGLRTHCDELVWIDGGYPVAANDLQPDRLTIAIANVDRQSPPINESPQPPFRLSRNLIIQQIQRHRLTTHLIGQTDE